MRREKKSESLEVRLSHNQKKDFMEICKERGTTASDAVRGFISGVIEDARRTETEKKAPARLKELSMTLRNNPRKALTAGAGAFGAFALFAATPSVADDNVFERLDQNGDGLVTLDEISPAGSEGHEAAQEMFAALDRDDDGTLTSDEFLSSSGCIVSRTDKAEKKNGEGSRTISIKMTAYDLSDPEMTNISIMTGDVTLDADASEEDIKQTADDLQKDLRERLKKETGGGIKCEGGAGKKKIRKQIEKSVEQ
ncbi:MAG: hypothetical protein AAGA69_00625 [Pseudomonadota bacterium]